MTTILVALPIAIGVVGVALGRMWRADLPDPVATHWGWSGVPEGFMSTDTAVWLGGFGGLQGLVLGGTMLAMSEWVPEIRRGSGALVVGMSTLVTTLMVGSLAIQRGLADAASAPGVGGLLGLALAAGAVAAVLGGLAVGAPDRTALAAIAPVPASAPRADLAQGVSAHWSAWATSSRWVYAVLVFFGVPLVIALFSGGRALAVLIAVLAAGLLMVATSTYRVGVGESGLTVRSVLGWPSFEVPLGEVAEARAVTVDPMREFGGVGMRVGRDHRFGVVLRKGEALEVVRGNGSAFLVTVAGAGDAAALLNTLADRERRVT